MAYYLLPAIKKNFEIQPDDTSIDPTLALFGAEADAHIDSLLGNGIPLSTVPALIREASSNYAAGRYLSRVKEDIRGNALMEQAEKEIMQYKNGPGRVVVFG